mgnify:CR=1 FL=1
MGTVKGCPFCDLDPDRVLFTNRIATALYDAYPVTPGHMLVIPNVHVSSIFELSWPKRQAMMDMVELVRDHLGREYKTNCFNIGINEGVWSGQTVDHAHIHIIPRYKGDVPDPKGGIRWIFPDKAAYWEKTNDSK